MTTLNLVRGGHVRPAPPTLRSRCDEHSVYVAGCAGCQARNRERQRQQRKAAILGTHQSGLVSSIGAARRLQGLSFAGYEAVDLSAHLEVHREQVRRWRTPISPTISRRRHNDIAALADRLDGTVGPSRRARTIAHREGWHPLAAWDDIDNPDEVPQLREAHHVLDPRPLIHRVLTGRASIDVLTLDEQAKLWRQWARQREQQNLVVGVKTFAREFDISHHRVERIIAAAQTNNHAATSRTDRRVA